MPRLKTGFLRGSVMQNRPPRARSDSRGFFYKLKVGLYAALAGALTLFFAWLWLTGWYGKQMERLNRFAADLSRRTGFAVSEILVEGRENTPAGDIIAALEVKQGMPVFSFSPQSALERIKNLPWVAEAAVERRLPGTIYVRLTERVPMARWQKENSAIVVIDRTGKELPGASPERFSHLPLVVGESAPAKAEELFRMLSIYPSMREIMKAAVLVGERRWNLHLQPGVVVRLPEQGAAKAMKKLAELIEKEKILDRSVEAIDLRFSNRFIIEPTAGGAAQKTEKTKLP